ncbi:helix-turn-helix domain-containing protein [Burkholderia pseudomultivorans]|uniref:helix-turn-helix transcriptional regulator n=1 Tax=Burkholderia pseudomultivorans TaxID=1207504 RepID=UPI002876C9DB|nr:helix-turn-helix domain-containing protein [Burkholderia pseudomultivorans]MDS0796973.1 helix-turn-helix domain-containing protein [Burkholderia pseudomultivorans]
MDRLLDPKDLAALARLAVQTVYNRHSTGGNLPPCIKLGRLLRFRSSDVEAWLASQLSSPGQQPVVAQAPAARRRGRPTKAEQVAARRSH